LSGARKHRKEIMMKHVKSISLDFEFVIGKVGLNEINYKLNMMPCMIREGMSFGSQYETRPFFLKISCPLTDKYLVHNKYTGVASGKLMLR